MFDKIALFFICLIAGPIFLVLMLLRWVIVAASALLGAVFILGAALAPHHAATVHCLQQAALCMAVLMAAQFAPMLLGGSTGPRPVPPRPWPGRRPDDA